MRLISIKRVDAVILRSDIDHIVIASFDSNSGDKERLCIHRPINRVRDPFAKVLCSNVARVENSLVEVLPRAEVIVVKGQNGKVALHRKVLVKSKHPSPKIRTCEHNQEHQGNELSRSEKVDAHRNPFLTCSL